MAIPHLETAIKFSGLNVKKTTSQPPINDKDGKPYNLDDPEFPVIKDHEFKVNYWAMPKTRDFFIKYLVERWHYYNRTKFHGKLQEPNIDLLKDLYAGKMRTRGLWKVYTRELLISPNLFNAPHEGWVNRVLLHEMCHQSVWEIHGPDVAIKDGAKTKGHGPVWQSEMRRVGLPPSRFDDATNDTYMGRDDLKREDPQRDFRANLAEARKKYGPPPAHLEPYLPVLGLFLNRKEPTPLILIGAAGSPKRKGKWWAYHVELDNYVAIHPVHLFDMYPADRVKYETERFKREVRLGYDTLMNRGERIL
jgi:hypothetical protein